MALKTNTQSLFLSLFLLFFWASSVQRVEAVGTPSAEKITGKSNCRIEIDNAHFSTSLYEQKLAKYVKVNAKSICNQVQRSVELTVEIYKDTHFGPILIRKGTTPISSSGKEIKNEFVSSRCLSTKATTYFGIAYSKALINGKLQFAGRTQSSKKVSLACGT